MKFQNPGMATGQVGNLSFRVSERNWTKIRVDRSPFGYSTYWFCFQKKLTIVTEDELSFLAEDQVDSNQHSHSSILAYFSNRCC